MDQEEDLLECLLAVATEELDKLENSTDSTRPQPEKALKGKLNTSVLIPNKNLKETDIFHFEQRAELPLPEKSNSVIHHGDTDSSDEEGNRNFEEQKYNEYGREIKSILNPSQKSAFEANSIASSYYGVPKKRVSTWKNNPNSDKSSSSYETNTPSLSNKKPMFGKVVEAENKFKDVFMDPIFGMRIINPLISSSLLIEKMQGRLAVRLSDLSGHILSGNLKDKDWVICGALASKSPPKTSSKGGQFSIWTLSDLKDDIKTYSLFLFNNAHTNLWKTAIGTVVGVLNPAIMDQKDGSRSEVSLSVNNAQKIMIFGQSKDFGICKSIKKNGEKCTAIVNLSRCEYCIYHIKQEYQKCSKRSELQANFVGRGLVNLRNKVLGKNEVFYAGKSYTAIPAKRSKKLEVRDQNILKNLSEMGLSSGNTFNKRNVSKNKNGVARQLDTNPAQRARDLKLLEKLGGTSLEIKMKFSGKRSDEITLEESKSTALTVINKLKTKKSDSDKCLNKNSQYNMKSDLFVNVENKNRFSGNISEQVSLAESKNRALKAISELKAKSNKNERNGSKEKSEFDNEDFLSIEEIENQLESSDLNYSEDEGSSISNILHDLQIDKTGVCKSLQENNVIIEKTLKSTKGQIESFGKISPKLTKTQINPNNLEKLTETSVSIPKSTPNNDNCSPVGLIPNNLGKSFLNDPEVSRKECLDISKSLDKHKHDKGRSISQEPLNITLSDLDTQCNSNTRICSKELDRKSNLNNMVMGRPLLSNGGKNDLIDLSKPITSRHVNRAKLNAVKYIQRNGPIKKIDPNSTRNSGSTKRNIECVLGLNNDNNNVKLNTVNEGSVAKKSKLQESQFISDRFKKMMAMTSKYAGLLEQHDDEEKEKYFKKLETKEQMEEKMVNTHKVKCKAVRCLQCKYTSFSASEFCKSERHPLKVFDAMKRFYKCSNCQNRIVTLELVPTKPCNNCGSSKWEKTGMMKEKIAMVQHNLSIRGGEQKFLNANIADANLDLLVPDD